MKKIMVMISALSMTVLLSLRGPSHYAAIGLIAAMITLVYVWRRSDIIDNLIKYESYPTRNKLFACIYAIATSIFFVGYFYEYYEILGERLPQLGPIDLILSLGIMLGILASYSVFLLYAWWMDQGMKMVRAFAGSMTGLEKRYLTGGSLIIAVVLLVVYSQTSLFYGASIEGDLVEYNVIYTTDSGDQLASNVYGNIGAELNDIRQPLFGLYALPFAVTAKVISTALFFLPSAMTYGLILQWIQACLLLVGILLLSRMMKLDKVDQGLFLMMMSVSYPVILFTVTVEQYIFPVFWLILFLYNYKSKKNVKDFFFIGAVGGMLTSGFFFPLLSKERSVKGWLGDMFSSLFKALGIIAVFGQFALIVGAIDAIRYLFIFVGDKLSFYEKMVQYTGFVQMGLFRPLSEINGHKYDHLSYQLVEATSLNLIGLALLVLGLIGVWYGRKSYIMKVAGAWIAFSFLLLGVVGWGSAENGMILYGLYFGPWLVVLVYGCLHGILKKFNGLRWCLMSGLIIAMAYWNILGIIDLVGFGMEHYPA